MIRIILGLPGSGKSAFIVREMYLKSKRNKLYYSNIETKGIKNNNSITRDMIFKKELIKEKKDGTPIYDLKLNQEFWRELQQENKLKNQSLSVIIDEAHSLMNPRRSMSKINIIMGDFMSLLRRILGSSDHGYGELILITQLKRRLDVIAVEMSTQIQWCRCLYIKECQKCKMKYPEDNEKPNKRENCLRCGSDNLIRKNFIIEVTSFKDNNALEMWQFNKLKTYYDRFYITDIEKYFKNYDTLQWDNLISDIYE